MTDKPQIHISIDDRERNLVILNYLREAENTNIEIKRLTIGDYYLNNLIIERKTFSDFVTSIKDGRLFLQATRLNSTDKHSMFIIEGTFHDTLKTKMKREAIQGALLTLELIFKIPVLKSISPVDSAKIMLYAANQVYRNEVSLGKYFCSKQIRRCKKKYGHQMQILQGIPSIGPVKAELLLKEFGSVNKIFNSSPDQLVMIRGIGRVQAEQIFKIVNENVM